MSTSTTRALPERAQALIEVPRGSFVKRELHGEGQIEFVSPIPCPFNYGCLPDWPGPDGDPLDALVLGPRLPLGTLAERPVVGVVRFWDAGHVDDKLILGGEEPDPGTCRKIDAFFRVYAVARRLMNARKGLSGPTSYAGLVLRSEMKAFVNRG